MYSVPNETVFDAAFSEVDEATGEVVSKGE